MLFLGNAGTAMSALAALRCLQAQDVTLTGEPYIKERPIGHLVEAQSQGGAQIDYLEHEYYRPLRLRGSYQGGDVSFSSQFLTARLMMAPWAPQDNRIRIKGELASRPYIDFTLAFNEKLRYRDPL